MMDQTQPLCCFSRGGEFLATYNGEGEVKVWDSASGSLQQTFLSGDLSGKITCLAWARPTKLKSTKKRRSSQPATNRIAACVGSKVIIWNLTKGEEENVLSSGHKDGVTCADWDSSNSTIYSGSKDKYIVEWNVDTGKSTKKWKADKTGVQCLCCYGDGSVLVTAGRAIKIWNLEDYSLSKKVTGHASSISRLSFLSEDLFLSASLHDRVINLWQLSGESSSALTTLTCNEEVLSFSCCEVEGEARIASFSQDGCVQLFRFAVSDPPPSPITPTSTLHYISPASKTSTSAPLPVLAIFLGSLCPDTLTVAHSSSIRPSIENIDFSQPDEHVCLIRDSDPSSILLPQTKSSRHTPQAMSPKVTILGPGNMTLPIHKLPTEAQSNELRPLSERLDFEAKKSKDHAQPPTADSLTQLLVQSVASGDGKLMEEVLRVSKEKIVIATVQRLPVHTVLPFMRKLVELLQKSPSRGLELSLWIKTLISAHAAYLMTVPQLAASLSPLYQLLEARTATFSRLCQLQGKLDLTLAQSTNTADQLSAARVALTTPLLSVTLAHPEDAAVGITDEMQSESEEDISSDSDDQLEQGSGDISMESTDNET